VWKSARLDRFVRGSFLAPSCLVCGGSLVLFGEVFDGVLGVVDLFLRCLEIEVKV
jgi:hypothetical protein